MAPYLAKAPLLWACVSKSFIAIASEAPCCQGDYERDDKTKDEMVTNNNDDNGARQQQQ